MQLRKSTNLRTYATFTMFQKQFGDSGHWNAIDAAESSIVVPIDLAKRSLGPTIRRMYDFPCCTPGFGFQTELEAADISRLSGDKAS